MHPRSSAPWIALAFGIGLTACRPATSQLPPPTAAVAAVSAPLAESPTPSTPQVPVAPPRVTTWTARGVKFEGVTFDSRSHRLIVIDQPAGPGSRFATATQAARSAGGIAAVNAGFFTPQGEPLGLVVSHGNVVGSWNSASSLGSGVWYENAEGNSRIVRRQSLGATAARRMSELLQAGPMLVENSQPVNGLHGGEPRPRTLITWDGGHRWWIGCTAPCSMPDLAAALATGAGPGFTVRTALNLDGGRSSELWVGNTVSGGSLTRRSIFNRTVRNHLVLVAR